MDIMEGIVREWKIVVEKTALERMKEFFLNLIGMQEKEEEIYQSLVSLRRRRTLELEYVNYA